MYSPDADGNVVDITDPTGVDTHIDFYADNSKAEYTQASQDTSGDSYTGAVKNTTAYLYDAAGNLVTTYSPSAWARHTGNQTYSDPNNTSGTPTANTYSFDNLLLTTTGPVAPDGSVQRQTAYTYDGAGLKTSQHILEVNGSGNPISGKDAGTQTFGYYPDARAQTQVGTDSRTVTSQYDPAGDAARSATAAAPTLSGTYYLDGLARTVFDGTVTSEYAYDGLAQPTAREDVNGSTQPKTTYAYNAAELTSSLHFAPAGSNTITQTPSYDKAGRMTGAATTAGTLTLSYNADNTVALDKVVNGATTLLDWTYLYDPAKRITQQQFSGTGNGGTPNQSTLCYAYDLAGRLNTAFSAAAGTACGTAPAANVTWDHNGNRLSYGGPLTTLAATFTYNADDSIATEQDGTNAVRTYTDANFGGISSDGCATYLYDGFYRTNLASASGCNLSTTTYTYDALDRTHSATAGSVTQTFHYDGWTKMTSLAVPSTGTLTSYELSQHGQPLGLQQSSTNQQLFDDGHANVGTVVSTAASVACTARFDPFGTALTLAGTVTPGTLPSSTCNTGTSSSTPNTYFYRSARQDPGTGDYQLGSRLYDPSKGSFLVPDTSATGSPAQNPSVGSDPLLLNTYTYVNGDPVNLVDPDGHRACADQDCYQYTMPQSSTPSKVLGSQVMVNQENRAYARYELPAFLGSMGMGCASCDLNSAPWSPYSYVPPPIWGNTSDSAASWDSFLHAVSHVSSGVSAFFGVVSTGCAALALGTSESFIGGLGFEACAKTATVVSMGSLGTETMADIALAARGHGSPRDLIGDSLAWTSLGLGVGVVQGMKALGGDEYGRAADVINGLQGFPFLIPILLNHG